jgi:uncharacterized membrane protein YcaP (DUF421 family)
MMEETLVVMVRAFITFFTLLIYTRILGKQQMGNLSFFDYITGITIGSIGANLATDLASKAWVHWVGLSTFIGITLCLQYATLKSRYFSKVVDSEPTIVIQEGKILEDNLSKLRVKYDELMVLLRQKEVFEIPKVKYAILEPNGKLSVLLKGEHQPLTPKDIAISPQKSNIVTEVIYDGILIKQNLEQRNVTEEWLVQKLAEKGIQSFKEVSFAAVLPNGTLYVDLYHDGVGNNADISDYKGPF